MIDTSTKPNENEWWLRPLIWLPGLLSIPFLLGAIKLANMAATQPAKAGELARAQTWEAAVFSLGLFIGLASVGMSLSASTNKKRAIGLAGVLLGLSGMSLGYLVAWSMVFQSNFLPFMLPSILLFSALMLFANAMCCSEENPPATEEQQSPQSQP